MISHSSASRNSWQHRDVNRLPVTILKLRSSGGPYTANRALKNSLLIHIPHSFRGTPSDYLTQFRSITHFKRRRGLVISHTGVAIQKTISPNELYMGGADVGLKRFPVALHNGQESLRPHFHSTTQDFRFVRERLNSSFSLDLNDSLQQYSGHHHSV